MITYANINITPNTWTMVAGQSKQFVASGGDDQYIFIWEIATEQILFSYKDNNWIRDVAFSPDNKSLASTCGESSVKIWDINRQSLNKELSGHSGEVRALAFNQQGTMLATGGQDSLIKVWDVETGNCLFDLKGHTEQIRSIRFNSSGVLLVSGCEDYTAKVWNVESRKCILSLENHEKQIIFFISYFDGITIFNKFIFFTEQSKKFILAINQTPIRPGCAFGNTKYYCKTEPGKKNKTAS